MEYNYGERIKAARKAAGLTQEQLASKCGLATITIRQYESGKRQPRLTQIKDLATATGTTVQKLLDIPSWVDEKNIWETVDTLDQSGMTQDEIREYLDQLEDVRSASELMSDIKLYEKVRAYVLDSLISFTPDGLLRLVDAINELKKVPYYQRLAQSSEDESEVQATEDFQLLVDTDQFEKGVKMPPIHRDDIPHEE